MPIVDVFRTLNQLKKRKIIHDWALIGSVAALAYMEPIATQDVDVVVLVDSDEQWLEAMREIQRLTAAHWEDLYLIVGGIPVQVLPSNMSLIYEDAVRGALTRRVGNIRAKFASPEHLIVLGLVAFRPLKDWPRIGALYPKADKVA